MSPIKVGVIGLSSTGWASNALAPGLLNAPSFSLTAVSTTSAASAEASAQKYSALAGHPVKPFHGDASGIANDKDVDLVAVSVKAPAHKAAALAVIAAGKDVEYINHYHTFIATTITLDHTIVLFVYIYKM
ncbi:hypothetical protein FIBSPDRAFT_898888 [Athelia psychrophila]|uniref:Gfo/Idh/MocA-like oxidoreductase N-terminal domain-containing protein n=1 Tax=Athelia psychrophila TaxID=1759441 RepID=A0A166AIH3_9AGAM|nr:hypothetical protein FIBSPDRAFT_898888 [Fibularhizoctonia sp. CBS 109695]